MSKIASQITSFTIVYSTVYSGPEQRKHQSSASLAFVRGIHRGLVNSPHKWPVTRKIFPFDDVIMIFNAMLISIHTCFTSDGFMMYRQIVIWRSNIPANIMPLSEYFNTLLRCVIFMNCLLLKCEMTELFVIIWHVFSMLCLFLYLGLSHNDNLIIDTSDWFTDVMISIGMLSDFCIIL